MWQDDYISLRDNCYVCWDYEGEYIADTKTYKEAVTVITNYKDIIKREHNERIIQQSNGALQRRRR